MTAKIEMFFHQEDFCERLDLTPEQSERLQVLRFLLVKATARQEKEKRGTIFLALRAFYEKLDVIKTAEGKTISIEEAMSSDMAGINCNARKCNTSLPGQINMRAIPKPPQHRYRYGYRGYSARGAKP